MLQVYITNIWLILYLRRWCVADLKGCPFGQDIKNDCKTCDYGDTNHFDAASGQCVRRWFYSSNLQGSSSPICLTRSGLEKLLWHFWTVTFTFMFSFICSASTISFGKVTTMESQIFLVLAMNSCVPITLIYFGSGVTLNVSEIFISPFSFMAVIFCLVEWFCLKRFGK